MENKGLFRFHGSLNDFLPASKKQQWFVYNFKGTPSLKDTIEAIGVPHPEIAFIEVNNHPAQLTQLMNQEDKIEVYPEEVLDNWRKGPSLIKTPPAPRFILDVHLGKLAKYLRLLGFDAHYENGYDDRTIADLAKKDKRIVLTRDIGLLKHNAIDYGYWLRSQQLEEQLNEVVDRFKLKSKFTPFTRCLSCNNRLYAIEKEKVQELLPPKTIEYFNQFYQCAFCKKVFWKGSHFERMEAFINLL